MAEFGDGTSCSSTAKTDNEDTRRLMASMQKMMGTLVQKVTEMEKKYDELSKAKDSSDSVYENVEKEMYTAPGRGEEDNLSSISAASRREERVSTDSKKKGCAAGGSKEEDSASDSDFCVTLQGPEEDVFALLEADLEKEEQAGKPVAEKLANITKNRFSVKLSEKKLKEKMDSHQIPENCLEIKAPLLNEEIVEKGNLDRATRKLDSRLLNIQQLIAKATAALVNATDKLHSVTTALADPSARVEQGNMRFVEAANETLAANGDVIALLGTAQQELSYRRRYQLQPALPKDMGSICSNVNIPITDKLFGDDVEKAIKTARETYKIKSAHTGGHRHHPYKRTGHNRSFLGQASPQYNQRGNFHGQRARGKPWNQRGIGKFRGKSQ